MKVEAEKIVQMSLDSDKNGVNLFCLTNRGRIFVRMSASDGMKSWKEWALVDLPTFSDNVTKFPKA